MNTLVTPPLAPLLAQLLTDAEATTANLFQQLSPEEIEAFKGKGDYRELYGRMKDYHLAVSKDTGVLLYMLARSTRARSIIEFGTSFGISTLHLAAALKDNDGGRVITTEFEPSKVVRARDNIRAANLTDYVEIREGDALETLAHDLPDTIDLVLLDGAKSLYPRVLSLLEPHIRVTVTGNSTASLFLRAGCARPSAAGWRRSAASTVAG